MTHSQWIDAQPLIGLKNRGKCKELSEAMIKEFPELRLAAGYYHDAIWGKQQHWWCVTPDGAVVDPTARQFPTQGDGEYEELNEEERPVGTCMDCGKDVFANKYAPEFCNEACRTATMNYLNSPNKEC